MQVATALEIDSAAAVLQGGGEMGERMRAIDWSCTVLGPVSSWPLSLRTCVRIVLTSRQPMFVWWGNELINLYNDAYKTIVGGKHPQALGQPARVVWREIWHEVGPLAEAAMRRNEGAYEKARLLIMERNGYEEETYYTFSYSPVPGDEGGVGGIICANTDDTEKIVGTRQVRTLRDLAARTSDARSAETACARAAESLAQNPWDLPFALLYLTGEDRRSAQLVACAGIDAAHAAAPATILLDDDNGVWPLAEALRSSSPVLVAPPRALRDGLPSGAWHRMPERIATVRILPTGERGRAGLLVAGLSPHRLFDESYYGFVDLIAGQIAAAIAGADAYQQQQRRAEELAAIDRAKTVFFSNVSHEFRTPLTLMLGPTEDALDSGALEGESLKIVHRNQQRLLKLVNNLLDFARIEAGRMQASYAPTDLGALTADLASSFRAAVERAGLTFSVSCEALPEPVFVDREMWERVVLNLLSNAFKFTLSGSIRVSLRRAGSNVELAVSDTGAGIPEAELDRIFERFHRVAGDRARTHEGSGIGLALIHELVRLHGGTISVSSLLGQGSTFVVQIPTGSAHLPADRIVESGPAAATAPVPAPANAAVPYVEEVLRWLPDNNGSERRPATDVPESAPAPGGHVLVADDNADMRQYIRRVLEPRWTVETVATGRAALESARARPPDLILTDVMMPELDGFGLLRELDADPRLRAVPVVMLSARAGEEARIEGLQAGADDYLVKPFSARELRARIDAQIRLARARTTVEAERRRFYSFLDQAPVAIMVFEGPDLTVAYGNELARGQLGEREVVGKPLRAALPELHASPIPEHLARVFRTGDPHTVVEEPVAVAGPGGALAQRYLTTLRRPLRDENGTIYGVISVAQDVTEAVLAKKALETKSIEAQAASRAKDEFLAMLGHELRNPLAPISTALQLMQLRAGDVLLKERTIIERQVKHLVRLVDDLLEVSRIARGKISLERVRIDLGDVLARALEMTSPLIEQRDHHLSVDVASGLAVDADPARLAQVFANLLTNAAKYTPPRGFIDVAARREDGAILVVIRDSGIGIRAEMLPRIFDLFVQERQALDRSEGGLGLGLTIVRSLVGLHGGSVEARSAGTGRGTEVLVRLPIPRDEATALTAAARTGHRRLTPVTGVPATRSRRVLVVDDNEDAVESLADALAELGHTVETAYDGPAALGVLQRYTPDVAFLDVGLPVMDGYELARRIREDRRFARTVLIAVTGYGQKRDRAQSREAGFDAHLVKPVDLRAIEEIIAREAAQRAADR
jgi:signal transduction histidine kinase/DNA-binding response OmpR family regulator